jgi:hypothetical protein
VGLEGTFEYKKGRGSLNGWFSTEDISWKEACGQGEGSVETRFTGNDICHENVKTFSHFFTFS